MNACPDKTDLVLYAAGEMPSGDARALEAHLAACPACHDEVVDLKRGLAALAHLEREPALPPRLARTVENHTAPRARPRIRSPWRWAAAAAAILVAAVGVWTLMQPKETDPFPDPAPTAARSDELVGEALDEIDLAIRLIEADEADEVAAVAPAWDSDALDEIELLLDVLAEPSDT